MFMAQFGFILITSFICKFLTGVSLSLILGELFCFIPVQISVWMVFGKRNNLCLQPALKTDPSHPKFIISKNSINIQNNSVLFAKKVLQKIIISELTKLCLIILFFVLAFKWSNLLEIYHLFFGFVIAQVFQLILQVVDGLSHKI